VPRRHREGIDKQPLVAVQPGQVWEHRWNHNRASVLSQDLAADTVLMVHPKRNTTIGVENLLRDYILVDA
jgi:hypothetical protein